MRVPQALRWLLGLGLLLGLILWYDPRSITARLVGVDGTLALVAIAALIAVQLVGAAAWRHLARSLADLRLSWPDAAKLYYAAQTAGIFTPANLGADAYRLLAADPGPGGRGRATLPIVVQRVTSYIALVLIAAAALPLLSAPSGVAGGLVWSLLVVALLAVALAALLTARRSRLVVGLAARVGWVDDGVSHARLVRAAVVGFLYALVFHVASIVFGYLLVRSVTTLPGIDPIQVIACIAIARLSLAIPISPSGLGIQEGMLSLLFVGIGLGADVALATSLLSRVAMLGTAAIGALFVFSPKVPTRPARHPATPRAGAATTLE